MGKVAHLEQQNKSFVLATIIESKGSTPRHIGKMIVYKDGSIEGTVGGGLAELYVIEESVKAIQKGQSKVVNYILDQDKNKGISMHCGGTLSVFIEVYVSKPELVIIGAGHLGLAVAKLADFLEYPYCIVDDRLSYCTKERFPNAQGIYVHEKIEEAILKAPINEQSYVTIFTKDSDDRALETVIGYSCPYIGMIGSKKKINRIVEKLTSKGISKESILEVFTPIGLEIGAETPEEIAISILGEMIKVHRM